MSAKGRKDARRLRLLSSLLNLQGAAPLTSKLEHWSIMVFEKKGMAQLDARLNLRLPSNELEVIRSDANMAGISMSETVRARYFGRQVVANADMVMIKELRRIGGLLKHIHNESNGTYSQQTAETLASVKNYIEKLSSDS